MLKHDTHPYIAENHLAVLNALIRSRANTSVAEARLARLYEAAERTWSGQTVNYPEFILRREKLFTVRVTEPAAAAYIVASAIDEHSGLALKLSGVEFTPRRTMELGQLWSIETTDTARGNVATKMWT